MTRPTKPKPRRMRSFLAWAVVKDGEHGSIDHWETGHYLEIYGQKTDRPFSLHPTKRWARVRVTEVVGKGKGAK